MRRPTGTLTVTPSTKGQSLTRTRGAQVSTRLAVLLWFASLFGPVYEWRPEEMMHGYKVLYVTLISGPLLPHIGPWAVLANFTLLIACRRIIRGVPPGRSLWLSFALPGTSPMYLVMLYAAPLELWGIWVWTAALVMLGVSALLARGAAGPAHLTTPPSPLDGDTMAKQ